MVARSTSFSRVFPALNSFKYLSLTICSLLVAFGICLSPAISSSSHDVEVPIHVIGQIRLEIPDDHYEEYKHITAALFAETEEQERPSLYTCNRDINDPSLFVWNEQWESYDAFQKHLNTAHFKHWYSYVQKYQVGDLNVIYAPVSAFKKV